ncbi:MAG TPA: N-6 DNA methylase, partial [Nitrosopumilaceae archaeon]|nr:N-6 DNA methylase [Nitrosopumilaceae archaeon]
MLSNSSLKSKINKLWDTLWSGGLTNPATAIEQISYLLFIRRLDKMDERKLKEIKGYKSIFAGKPNNLRWSVFTKIQTLHPRNSRTKDHEIAEYEKMRKHIETKVFRFIKELNNKDEPFSRHMKNAYFGIPKASLLKSAIESIEEIYAEIEKEVKGGQEFQDTQGDIYEYLLNQLSISGKNGQFRTPRHIIQLICELIDPKLNDKIADPASGTGGFLLGAYHHILRNYTSA